MDTYIPLPTLGLFASLLIHVALCGVMILIAKKCQNITDKSIVQIRGTTTLEKNTGKCQNISDKPIVQIRGTTAPEKNTRHARLFIPNVLARWPWPRRINPHYAEVKKEVDAWVASFRVFGPKAQDAFNRCNINLLSCLAYPDASKEHIRAGCDFMHVLYVFDEYSDRSTPVEVRELKDIILDVLRNPHIPRPRGEWVGGEVTRQFWELTIRNATSISQKRFIQSMDEYLTSVLQESIDKKDRRILDIKSYIDLRRRTGAIKPSFTISELRLDIPDEVMSHPAIQEMVLAAIDIIAFSNDIFSYNMEQRRGDDLHNIITCVMNEDNTDTNGAMLWVEDYLAGRAESFLAAMVALPQWEEPLNSQVKEYCNGLGQWVRANNEWSFESERYFGDKGLEIRKSRWMSLLPKKSTSEVGPVHIDGSLL